MKITTKNADSLRSTMEGIAEQTTYRHGPRKGQVNNRISLNHIKIAAVRALEESGFIEYRAETIYGDGYAATPAGVDFARNGI